MKRIIVNVILFLGSPITFLATFWVKMVKKAGSSNVISDKIFMQLGVLPVLDHYYQPMINPQKHLTKSLREDRVLTGIDLNVEEQLNLLSKFNYNEELLKIPLFKTDKTEFYYNNDLYMSGDAEYLYNTIRYFKPKRIFEIGSGHSTLMAVKAIEQNKHESDYICQHICVEPYEQPILEKIDVVLKREKVENIDLTFFQQLEANDILFIDSSHIIRPQGDVLFEYLELLPTLKKGVIVHVHDIFTPKDYLDEWIFDHKLWNEQYLLEAFLTFNSSFKIIGALNYLAHNHYNAFAKVAPVFESQKGREPGAFWMQRV